APEKPSLPTVEMPRASKPSLPPPRQAARATQPPALMPVVAPFEPTPEPSKLSAAMRARLEEDLDDDAVTITADTDGWNASKVSVAKQDATVQVAAPTDTAALVKKLIAPTVILAIIGVMIGGFFAFDGQGGKKKKASAEPAPVLAAAQPAEVEQPMARPPVAPSENSGTESALGEPPQPPTKEEGTPPAEAANEAAPSAAGEGAATAPAAEAATVPAVEGAAAAPAVVAPAVAAVAEPAAPVHEVKTAKGVVKLVDVRIDSKPAGATVMLVDNGKTSFLGTTPVATSLDASRGYDVIFTLEGRPTQMAHLDPAKDAKLAVSLGRSSKAKKSTRSEALDLASVVEKPAPETKATKAVAKVAEPAEEKTEKAEPKTVAKTVAKAEKAVAMTGTGEGTLMVSSKPPCEIYIDGKATGLTTPQRSITLPVGAHKVTFVNAAEKITKTVPVTINADQPTKLIQDLMKK
ncbi:MAG: hypothetical protein HOV81_17480, partial [Kofleriaceae bacterium]|nr:hypothetical protein [Kofleriaceae bacterium]